MSREIANNPLPAFSVARVDPNASEEGESAAQGFVLPIEGNQEGIRALGFDPRAGPPSERDPPGDRRLLLDQVGRRIALGPEEPLSNGTSLGRFRADGTAPWTSDGGVLRAVAGAGLEEYAQLTGPEILDFRARFRYLTEDTRYVEVTVRMGAPPVNYYLPVDRPGAWREVEIVAADDAVSCVVDGWLQLRGPAEPCRPARGPAPFASR